ncbi:MAG: L,D-transpeptidase [Anaerolineales bacterium]|nr:L,D-transpeptidase [Anaerolineales bacterium]
MNNPSKRNAILTSLLIIAGCAVFLFAAWSAMKFPALASILNTPAATEAARAQPFAQVMLAKPASESGQGSVAVLTAATPTAAATLSAQQTEIPPTEIIPTLEAQIYVAPTETPTLDLPIATPENTSEPGAISAVIIEDTPTPEYVAPTAMAYAPVTGSGVHWIDVDLSQQRVYAYEGDAVVNSFIVSTGTWQTPTVTGEYHIWVKYVSAPMSGPGYYLPNVPYVMYFYGSYGLHGTYWHNNFGTPMSHGCVNLSIPDSEWLYNFSSVGTLVNVHY